MGAEGVEARDRFPLHLFDDLAEPKPDSRIAESAAEAFPARFLGMSAKTGLSQGQARSGVRFFTAMGLFGLFEPGILLAVAGTIGIGVFALIMVYRLALILFGPSSVVLLTNPASLSLLLPTYTILIALKDEAACMPQLANSLMSLEYPRRLLDVKLLLEEGDDETKSAIHAQIWPEGTELLVLPPGKPQTKPRALNYGLARAKGAFVTVYDAEDRPNPGQLIDAVRRFAWDPDLACVQAPLSGYVRGGSWLARHWALEYAIQFNRLMPALARLRMPIPLGGTSNHFRETTLQAVGGWDAWNVTEDADLGLRLARLGKKVDVIAPSTVETPPQQLGVWVGQRSRWLKGFVQTWLVLMRNPLTAIREMGIPGFLSMQLTLGASILSALVHLPWLVWCLICLLSPAVNVSTISWAMLVAAYAVGAISALTVPSASFAVRLRDVLTIPFYWPLQFIAMSRALYSLFRRPHFWVKTPHDPET